MCMRFTRAPLVVRIRRSPRQEPSGSSLFLALSFGHSVAFQQRQCAGPSSSRCFFCFSSSLTKKKRNTRREEVEGNRHYENTLARAAAAAAAQQSRHTAANRRSSPPPDNAASLICFRLLFLLKKRKCCRLARSLHESAACYWARVSVFIAGIMTTKRAYKLQEFVAHSTSVNCLKIGRKSSRVLVTGGEDHKVNLWAIGKPNAILSLSGHASAVESVSFDSSEVFVAAGAASGTIKLWDLEEAKIVRTLTGHRSNCISVDFHPFGEFFASGSLDTNLKIWDIRRKGCIHTYKGHTRGVNAIRFTPDGRWVVSGGEDNIVKLWDLTAGKLLHDFKCHEGQIQCIDFHPHEFLLATGSADRTVKFWDLETFELIGSSGPETAGVRAMTFNPDGRTLLTGLHESLKVYSWEPIRCHDAVDVGWSKLSDLNIHEGKLLGCSYNQSCVGVWVVDISRIEPYAIANTTRSNGHSELKSTSSGNVQTDNSLKARSVPGTPQRVALSTGLKTTTNSLAVPNATTQKRITSKAQSATNIQIFSKPDVIPVTVSRTSTRVEQASDSRKEAGTAGRTVPSAIQSKVTDLRRLANSRDDPERTDVSFQSGLIGPKNTDLRDSTEQNFFSGNSGTNRNDSRVHKSRREAMPIEVPKGGIAADDSRVQRLNRDAFPVEASKGGRTRSLVANWENRERSPTYEGPTTGNSDAASVGSMISSSMRVHPSSAEKETVSASDEDAIADVLEQHDLFFSSMQSRLTKLQIVRRFWERNDLKGAINALEKMSDHAVLADVVAILLDKSDNVTLDICTCLLPVLTCLLESKMDRLERCNLCYVELEKVKRFLPSLTSAPDHLPILSASPVVYYTYLALYMLIKFVFTPKTRH
ncbi:hypothetical protein ACLOJK_017041 [Asimina triloba]